MQGKNLYYSSGITPKTKMHPKNIPFFAKITSIILLPRVKNTRFRPFSPNRLSPNSLRSGLWEFFPEVIGYIAAYQHHGEVLYALSS